jgi:hypothetical protein
MLCLARRRCQVAVTQTGASGNLPPQPSGACSIPRRTLPGKGGAGVGDTASSPFLRRGVGYTDCHLVVARWSSRLVQHWGDTRRARGGWIGKSRARVAWRGEGARGRVRREQGARDGGCAGSYPPREQAETPHQPTTRPRIGTSMVRLQSIVEHEPHALGREHLEDVHGNDAHAGACVGHINLVLSVGLRGLLRDDRPS